MSEIEKYRRDVSTEPTEMSLIGVWGEYPVEWGNYFWIKEGRVLNFWAENLVEAEKRFNLGGKVSAFVFEEERVDSENKKYKTQFVVIDDPRIPRNWYYKRLYFTGYWGLSRKYAEMVYNYLGDPENEIELWDNPVNYYFRRGKKYSNGMIIVGDREFEKAAQEFWGDQYLGPIRNKTETRIFKSDYTIETTQDLSAVHGLDLETELKGDKNV